MTCGFEENYNIIQKRKNICKEFSQVALTAKSAEKIDTKITQKILLRFGNSICSSVEKC